MLNVLSNHKMYDYIQYETGYWEIREVETKYRDYWCIETNKDIFKGINQKKELQKKAFDYLTKGNENFEEIIDNINGEIVKFRRISSKEYLWGSSNKILTTSQYKQKMRLAPSVDDLIKNAPITYHSPLKHKNKKFPNGFNNYQGIVCIDNNVFRYIVRVGNTNENKSVFYDVSLIFLYTKKGNTRKVHRVNNNSSLMYKR